MKIYSEFVGALDATGEHISAKLSEVDLSNPEDVRAVIPESGTDVLVHFGDSEYLERYRRFEKLLPEWRAQYPKLAGADMRYERQVVLEMQGGVTPEAAIAPAMPVAGAMRAKGDARPVTRVVKAKPAAHSAHSRPAAHPHGAKAHHAAAVAR